VSAFDDPLHILVNVVALAMWIVGINRAFSTGRRLLVVVLRLAATATSTAISR